MSGGMKKSIVFAILLAIISVKQMPALRSFEWGGGAKPSPLEVMNAVSYETHGSPQVLVVSPNFPKPIPKDKQVLIKVKASSVNPVDFKFRRNPTPNWLLPKPKIPGLDLAGVVVQVGAKVSFIQVGDRVAAMMPLVGSRWGSHAEYVAIDADLVSKLAESVDYESAASLPLVSLTVIQSLRRLQTLPTEGKKILIHAGAGGVGTFAIQYAKHVLGMHVATTASKEKADFLKTLGADLVIDYRTQDFTTVVQDYDAVLDTMSFLYEGRTLTSNVLRKSGHYLNIMSSEWSVNRDAQQFFGLETLWNLLKHKILNLFAPGRFLPKYDFCMVEPNGKQLQIAMDLLANERIKAVIDTVYPLSKVSDAHRHLETGHATGKIVIRH